jgi:hypothetical protein
MRAPPDFNVLIAQRDGGHLHHRPAARWLQDNIGSGWASCPITQNGCIRIQSQPAYPNSVPAAQVAARLSEAVWDASRDFSADDFSVVDPGRLGWTRVPGPRQVTDAYLLAPAVERRGRFVTFDRGITHSIVPRAQRRLLVTLA